MNFSPEDDRYIYELVSKNIKFFKLHNNSKFCSYGRMTQEQLAEKADLSQSFSIAVLYRIARVLEVDIKEFFVPKFLIHKKINH